MRCAVIDQPRFKVPLFHELALSSMNIANKYFFQSATFILFILLFLVYFTYFNRNIGIDPAYLILISREFISGRQLYTDIIDGSLPISVHFHSIPLYMNIIFDLEVMSSWNILILFCSFLSSIVLSRALGNSIFIFGIWFVVSACVLDDVNHGQREHILSIFLLPYFAMRILNESKYVFCSILSGLLVSLIICIKPTFVLFIFLIDIPILFFLKRLQNIIPFMSFSFFSIFQLLHFLIYYDVDTYLSLFDEISYYNTVGYNFYATFSILVLNASSLFSFSLFVFLIFLCVYKNLPVTYPILCGLVMFLATTIGVSQGSARLYYLIPVGFGLFSACVYCFSLYRKTVSDGKYVFGWVPLSLFALSVAASIALLAFAEGGIGKAYLKRYAWQQPDYARIGPLPADPYYDWVSDSVSEKDTVFVVALQYGGTSIFDPVLSTLRLNRRANSRAPILQFPLRAALVSQIPGQIESAWEGLREDVLVSGAKWFIVRQTLPSPLKGKFTDYLDQNTTFSDWFSEKFVKYHEFGSYVIYQRTCSQAGCSVPTFDE